MRAAAAQHPCAGWQELPELSTGGPPFPRRTRHDDRSTDAHPYRGCGRRLRPGARRLRLRRRRQRRAGREGHPQGRRRQAGDLGRRQADRRPQAVRREVRHRRTASPSRSRPSPRTCRPTSSPPPSRAAARTSWSARTTGSATWCRTAPSTRCSSPTTQKAAFTETAIKAVTFNGQLYGVPYAMENIALIRNTDLAPEAPDDHRGPGRRRQAAQGRRQGQRDRSASRSARTATPTTSTRSTPRAAATCSAPAANGDYDPKDLGVGKPELGRGVQEDRRARREGRAAR